MKSRLPPGPQPWAVATLAPWTHPSGYPESENDAANRSNSRHRDLAERRRSHPCLDRPGRPRHDRDSD